VPRVIARVFDPKRERIWHDLGVETICPTRIAAEALLARLAQGRSQAAGGGNR
jgi:trk system potassium uptake protein TrkA